MAKEDDPIFNPLDTIRYVAEKRGVPIDALKIPERLLLTYQRSAFECAKSLNYLNLLLDTWHIIVLCVRCSRKNTVSKSRCWHYGIQNFIQILLRN